MADMYEYSAPELIRMLGMRFKEYLVGLVRTHLLR